MEYVDIVRELVIDRVPRQGRDKIEHVSFGNQPPIPLPGDVGLALVSEPIEQHLMPVHEICEALPYTSEDVVQGRSPEHERKFICYTPNVQEFLEMPIDIYKAELEDTRNKLRHRTWERDTYRFAGFWARLKYAFTGKMRHG